MITVILKRDHEQTIRESTVGRILKYLKTKGLVTKSLSVLRMKRKRNFTKGHAKSSSAKRFLLALVRTTPFKILSIQVDGGSEFMTDFEQSCKDLGIPLIVLPTYNGGVERSHRTFREEFYAQPNLLADSLSSMKLQLKKALHTYNHLQTSSKTGRTYSLSVPST